MSGNIYNRESFLNKIAVRLGKNQTANVLEKPNWSYNPQDAVLKDASLDDLADVLREQCKNIHTVFYTVQLSELSEVVKNIIIQLGGGPIIKWKDPRFEEYGLSPLFNRILQEEREEVYEWDSARGEENIHIAEKANIGITISEITLAESGTAVLFSGKDRGRSISFLPSNSVIIIPKSSIVPRMTQAAKIIKGKVENGEKIASCINFITGPSNSADIEMNLVVGVHGPIKAAYIMVEDI